MSDETPTPVETPAAEPAKAEPKKPETKKPETKKYSVLIDRGVCGVDGKVVYPATCSNGDGLVELEPAVAAPLLEKNFVIDAPKKGKS